MIAQSSIVNPYHRCRSEITSCVSVEVFFPSNWINAAPGQMLSVSTRKSREELRFSSHFSAEISGCYNSTVFGIYLWIFWTFASFIWAHQIFTNACSLWSFLEIPLTRISIVVFRCYCNLVSVLNSVEGDVYIWRFELPYQKSKSSINSSQSTRNSTIVKNSQLRNIKSFVTKNIFISCDFELHSDVLSSYESKYELTFLFLLHAKILIPPTSHDTMITIVIFSVSSAQSRIHVR